MSKIIKDWNYFANLLTNKTPFSFSKFNDGEMNLIDKIGGASRGQQDFNNELSLSLNNAIKHIQPNYYIGLPCETCDKKRYHKSLNIVDFKSGNFSVANILINKNITKSIELFNSIFQTRNITLVCSEKANINKLPFKPKTVHFIQHKNGFDNYNKLKDGWKLLKKDDIALFCCGPLGRVLCYEWFKNNPNITCLELGSMYDPLTQNRSYLYQQGTLPLCIECNTNYLTKLPFPIEIYDKCQLDYINLNIEEANFANIPHHIQSMYFMTFIRYGKKTQKIYSYLKIFHTLKSNNLKQKYTDEMIKLFPHYIESYYYKSLLQPHNSKQRCEYLIKASKVPYTKNNKHTDKKYYDWLVDFDLSLHCYYTGDYEESNNAWERLVNKKLYPKNQEKLILDNGRYAKLKLSDKKDKKNGTYNLFKKNLKNKLDPFKKDYTNKSIPNIYHFIFIHDTSVHSYDFCILNFLAIQTCLTVQKPDKIFLYTNNNQPKNNIWWDKCKELTTVIELSQIPTHLNRTRIESNQHRVDVIRLNILNEIGGVYMDFDLLSLKQISWFDKYIVLPKESSNKLCNCFIMAQPNNCFLNEWLKYYEENYNNDWTKCSVVFPFELSKTHTYCTILDTKDILPISYRDFRIFDPNLNLLKELDSSYTLHLWDTELRKTNWYPKNQDYFKNNTNTFTKLFEKYII